MPYFTRRAYLRSEVARCFSNVTITLDGVETAVAIDERRVPQGDAIAGAFRCGNQEMDPVGEGRSGRSEVGTMTAYVRVEFRIEDADERQDEIAGLVEDALERAIEAYKPSAPWEHPLGFEKVQMKRIERRHLMPAVADDKRTGFVIIPFVVLFHRSR